MSKKVSDIIYSAKDIEQYLLGDLGNKEMYAIEKAALDDELLAQAIEGYEGMEEKNWDKSLADLKAKLANAENTPVLSIEKKSFAGLWRVAAAVLILISGIAIAYVATLKKTSATLAQVIKTNDKSASDTVNSNAEIASVLPYIEHANQSAPSPETTVIKLVIKSQLPHINATTATSKGAVTNNFVYTPNQHLLSPKNAIPTKDEEYYSNANGNAISADSINAVSMDNYLIANAIKEKESAGMQQIQIPVNAQTGTNANNNFNGRVVGVNNNPLPYAQIITDKNKAAVFTDANGNFKIASVDTSIAVEVTATGYAAKKITLQNAHLNQNILLNEVADVQKSFNSKKDKAEKAEANSKNVQQQNLEKLINEDAAPVTGWAAYNDYLLNNVLYSKALANTQMHGIVEVFIKLGRDGDITAIKVTKSLCPKCDAAVVRLVKHGPKWNVKNRVNNSARVQVKF